MRISLIVALAAALFVAPTQVAAQYQQTTTVQVVQPAPQTTTVVAQPARQARGVQYGASLMVPIWLGDAGDDLQPGIGVAGRIGWEFTPNLSAELTIGYQLNGVSSDSMFAEDIDNLVDLWIGGGLRYSFVNPYAIVPFIGAGIQANIWSCTECDDGTITVGFNGTVGAIYEVTEFVGIEAGAQINATLDGDVVFFDGVELYVSPFVGVTLYY